MDQLQFVNSCVSRVLDGGTLSADDLYAIAETDIPEALRAILDGAARVTRKFNSRRFDSCSIVNARSGRCSENCKWCAQSAHFNTGCHTYDIIDADEACRVAQLNAGAGIGRFSLVASGRSVRGRALDAMLDICKRLKDTGISTCASMGLLTEDELRKLHDAGVRRYHCNLETAPSFFPQLCTTHTQEDKLSTIAAARRLGFEICCGGIIGMGESRRQRVEFALTLREVDPVSIPINILSPIPGTPLEHVTPISEDEIILTVALFRLANPAVQLRFAGGRARLSRKAVLECMRVGINGAIVGNLLTTIGSTVEQDKEMVAEADYDF